MKKHTSKHVFNLIVVLFSVSVYMLIPYQTSDMQISYVSSSAFPTLLCITLFIVAVINGLNDLKTTDKESDVAGKFISAQAIAVYIIMLLSVLSISYIGFNLSMSIGSILILIALKLKKVYAYVLIPIIVYFISFIFTHFLYIDLPAGAI